MPIDAFGNQINEKLFYINTHSYHPAIVFKSLVKGRRISSFSSSKEIIDAAAPY